MASEGAGGGAASHLRSVRFSHGDVDIGRHGATDMGRCNDDGSTSPGAEPWHDIHIGGRLLPSSGGKGGFYSAIPSAPVQSHSQPMVNTPRTPLGMSVQLPAEPVADVQASVPQLVHTKLPQPVKHLKKLWERISATGRLERVSDLISDTPAETSQYNVGTMATPIRGAFPQPSQRESINPFRTAESANPLRSVTSPFTVSDVQGALLEATAQRGTKSKERAQGGPMVGVHPHEQMGSSG